MALKKIRTINDQINVILLGKSSLRGMGSGGDPEIGKFAAQEDQQIIREILKNTDLLFIVAGLGKGTGSGASPEIAKIAKEMGILTVAIVNFPSIHAEGSLVYQNALENYNNLKNNCDSITAIANDKIIKNNQENISFVKAFGQANLEITNIINEITQIIYVPTVMNVDFADLKSFFTNNACFMCNNLELNQEYSKESLQQTILNCLSSSYSEVNITDAKKVIINLKINESVPSSLVADIRNIFKEITGNTELTVVIGVDYTNQQTIKMSFLMSADATNTIISDFAIQQNNNVQIDQNDAINQQANFEQYNDSLLKTVKINKQDFQIKNNNDFDDNTASDIINKSITNVINLEQTTIGIDKEQKN